MAQRSTLRFNDSQDFLRLGMSQEMGILDHSFTWEIWVQFDELKTKTIPLISGLSPESQTIDLSLGIVENRVRISFSGEELVGKTQVSPGVWYLISFVNDFEQSKWALYINGLPDVSAEKKPALRQHLELFVGGTSEHPSEFRGLLTDFRCWNTAISHVDIYKNVFQSPKGDERGLVYYLPLDEERGREIDIRINPHMPGQISKPVWKNANGFPATLAQLHAVAFEPGREFMVIPDYPEFEWEGELSVSCWIKNKESASRAQILLDRMANDIGFILYLTEDHTAVFALELDKSFVELHSTRSIPIGEWTHIAVTFDTKSARLYVNGKLNKSKTTKGKYVAAKKTPLKVGAFQTEDPALGFRGNIAEIQLWDRGLSFFEIRKFYQSAPEPGSMGLRGYWRLREGHGKIIQNLIVDPQHFGILQKGKWERDVFRPAAATSGGIRFNMNRGGGMLRIDHLEDVEPKQAFTIEFWFKSTGALSEKQVLIHNADWILSLDPSLRIIIESHDSKSGTPLLAVKKNLQAETWYHLAIIADELADRIEILIDGGVHKAKSKFFGNSLVATFPILLGMLEGYKFPFQGQLAELRIWDRALDLGDVQDAMERKMFGSELDLIAYWPLDEGSGEILKDRSASHHPLIVEGELWESGPDLLNASNSIPSFNGTSSHLELPPITTDFSSGFSICMWAFSSDTKDLNGLFEFCNGPDTDTLSLYRLPKSTSLEFENITSKGRFTAVAKDILSPNEWMHLAITLDTKGECNIYKNGELVVTEMMAAPESIYREANYIGRLHPAKNSFFQGKMSAVSLWTKPLPQDFIQDLMESHVDVNEVALYAYWSLNEPNGYLSMDSGPNQLHGVLRDAEWDNVILPFATADTQVLSLDSQNHVRLGNMGLARRLASRQFTVEAWVKPRNLKEVTRNVICALGPVKEGGGWIVGIDDDACFVAALIYYDEEYEELESSSAETTQSAKPGYWYHLASVYDGKTISLFIDGVLQEKSEVDRPLAYSPTGKFQLGGVIDKIGIPESIDGFDGDVSEVRIWNKPLSGFEIQGRMRSRLTGYEPGLEAYWPMDEGSGDIAGSRLPGKTITETLTRINREQSQDFPAMIADESAAAELHGFGQYVTVRHEKAFLLKKGFTLSIWASAYGVQGKPTDYPLLSMRGPKAGWEMYMGMAQAGFVMAQQTAKSVINTKLETEVGEILSGRWYHLAVTYDGTALTLYINGILKKSRAVKGFLPFPTDIYIGRSTLNTKTAFKGRLAEVGIWETPLPAEMIHKVAYLGPQGTEKGLLAHWRLDEAHGSKAIDISPNKRVANLVRVYKTGVNLPVSGRLQFVGVDERDKFLQLWNKQDELRSKLEKMEKELISQTAKTKNLISRDLEHKKDTLRLIEEKKQLAKDHKAALEALVNSQKTKLDKLAKTQGAETTLRELIETANEQVVDARQALQTGGGGYQLGTVTMEMRVLPGQGGRGLVLPSKEELEKFDENQLSKLSFELAPQDKIKQGEEANTKAVPDISNLTELMAKRKLNEHGFKVEVHFQSVEREGDISLDGRVVRQVPKAGIKAAPGSSVSIFIGKESSNSTAGLMT